jgi:Na+-transporting NADH:ubiquinone oxidoreductase subunit D
MGRAEAFALTNKPVLSFVDGAAAGVGYSYVLIIISVLRELMGSGTIWGVRILGSWWTNWSIMVMAPGAFFVLALFIWVVRAKVMKPEVDKRAKP